MTDSAHGAVAQFFGVVRNHNDGLAAAAVDYDVHPELASKASLNCVVISVQSTLSGLLSFILEGSFESVRRVS